MERNALISGFKVASTIPGEAVVSLRGQIKHEPRPDWSPWGVYIKVSDEHPRGRPFYRENSLLPPTGYYLLGLKANKVTV